MDPSEDRHSKALQPLSTSDPDEVARLEAKNGIRQFDAAINHIESVLQSERPRALRPSLISTMNRFALEGITEFAGLYRPADIEIGGSKHKPPGAHRVSELVEELCDYVNESWNRVSPIHLAAYVLWRLNWIHPFVDGNGRTTRIISFIVLCVRVGYRLPGSNTIPDQIARHKKPYYEALEKADKAFSATGQVDVSAMEALVSDLLAKQLASILKEAGSDVSEPSNTNER
jgi:Fic family protein